MRQIGLSAIVSIVLTTLLNAQALEPLTPKAMQTALAARLVGTDAQLLAERIRDYFGRDNIVKGTVVKSDEVLAAWAVELPNASTIPQVVSDDGSFRLPMIRVGTTNVYAATGILASGSAIKWAYNVDGNKFGGGNLEVYASHPDMIEKPGVPKGKLIEQPKWQSKIFSDTTRDWWVYVPAQYKPDAAACVMVFQDGQSAKNYVPNAFDNLIHKGDMPVTVAIMIAPGTLTGGRSNRSFEYDTLSDQYARFLLEEILPEVEKTVKLRHDAESRAIGGISSGGICAFTVAWERPNEFNKVFSWVGSFTDIASGKTLREGGHNFAALIRKTPKKPIRVFLQDGENDLDNVHGNWPLANQQMAKSLAFMGYDYLFVYGRGFHSDRHGRSIMPDSLRWLWRKE